MRKALRSPWTWLALALILRIGFALHLGDRFHQTDELSYDANAWSLASTGEFAVPDVPSPIPVGFFALLFSLFGHHLLAARIGQALIGAAAAWMIGRATKELTRSDKAGLIASFVAAIYPFFVYYGGMLLSETLYVAFITAGLWLLCASLQDKPFRLTKAASGGLALGLAALCRAEGFYVVAIIWGAALIACLAGRWSWKAWALGVLCWALPILPWCARNQVRTGGFVLDNHGGVTLLIGTAYFDENEQDTRIAMEKLKTESFYQQAQALPPAAANSLYMRRTWTFMKEHPAKVLSQFARKFVSFWRFYPRLDKAFAENAASHPGAGLSRDTLTAISLLFEPLLIIGGWWGLWLLRFRWKELFPLPLFILGTMAVHVISVSQMRYRLPVMPALILGFAFLAERVKLEQGERSRQRKRG